jgi:hypothetical protein
LLRSHLWRQQWLLQWRKRLLRSDLWRQQRLLQRREWLLQSGLRAGVWRCQRLLRTELRMQQRLWQRLWLPSSSRLPARHLRASPLQEELLR